MNRGRIHGVVVGQQNDQIFPWNVHFSGLPDERVDAFQTVVGYPAIQRAFTHFHLGAGNTHLKAHFMFLLSHLTKALTPVLMNLTVL